MLYLSTVSGDVTIPELGIVIPHPTVDYKIDDQFTAGEVKNAHSLTNAIRSGTLTWKKDGGGSVQSGSDYDPDFLRIVQENTGDGSIGDRSVTFSDYDTPVQLKAGVAISDGTLDKFARADHTHSIKTASAITLGANSTSAEGSSDSIARADHTHLINTGNVNTLVPDQSNAEGSSDDLARSDHTHSIPTDNVETLSTLLNSNIKGVSNSFARADHEHVVQIYGLGITENNEVTTTSTSYVDVPDLSWTAVEDGTYYVAVAIVNSNNISGAFVTNRTTYIALEFNGNIVDNTEEQFWTNNTDLRHTYVLNGVLELEQGDVIKMKYRASGSTSRCHARSMGIFKLS